MRESNGPCGALITPHFGVYSEESTSRLSLLFIFRGKGGGHFWTSAQDGVQLRTLDRFLNVARKLKLEGLIGNDEDIDEVQEEQKYQPEIHQTLEEMKQLKRLLTPKITRPRSNQQSDNIVDIPNDNGENMTEEEHRQRLNDNVQINEDDTASCKVCGKTFNKTSNARRHVEVHIEGLNYSCS